MFENVEQVDIYVRVLVCFGLYIDVPSVSMRFSVIFCIYEDTKKYIYLDLFEDFEFFKFRNTFFLY